MIPNVIFHTTIQKMKCSEFYLMAKLGNNYSAENFIKTIVKPSKVASLVELATISNAIFCPVFAIESKGFNSIPIAYASYLAKLSNTSTAIVPQKNKVYHTGKNAIIRLKTKPFFIGEVIKNQTYILIDDVITSGSTIMALKYYIESNGGTVIAVSTIGTTFSPQTGHSSILNITTNTYELLYKKFNKYELNELLLQYGIITKDIAELSNSQAKYLSTFKGIDSLRNALINA